MVNIENIFKTGVPSLIFLVAAYKEWGKYIQGFHALLSVMRFRALVPSKAVKEIVTSSANLVVVGIIILCGPTLHPVHPIVSL